MESGEKSEERRAKGERREARGRKQGGRKIKGRREGKELLVAPVFDDKIGRRFAWRLSQQIGNLAALRIRHRRNIRLVGRWCHQSCRNQQLERCVGLVGWPSAFTL